MIDNAQHDYTSQILNLIEAQEYLRDVLSGYAERAHRSRGGLTRPQYRAVRSSQTIYIVLAMFGLQRKYGASIISLREDLKTYGDDLYWVLQSRDRGPSRKERQTHKQGQQAAENRIRTAFKRMEIIGEYLYTPQVILTGLFKEEMSAETCRTRLEFLVEVGLLDKVNDGIVRYAMTSKTIKACEGYMACLK